MTIKRMIALIVFAVALIVLIMVASQIGQGCATLNGRGVVHHKPDPSAHCERFEFWQRFF